SKVSDNDISLTIGGDGIGEHAYRESANELGLKIRWAGFLDRGQVLKEMQRCDAFILPSRNENLPMVLLEAIACGKPVIATRCGGPEIIVNAENGLLVPVEDEDALAEAMIYLKNNFEKYNEAVIREDFLRRFSKSVVTNQLMRIYEEL